MTRSPTPSGIHLFVEVLPKTVDFYRLLGFDVEFVSSVFARAVAANGLVIAFGTADLTRSHDASWQSPGSPSKNTINLELGSEVEVDEMYRRMPAAGYVGRNSPRDIEEDRRRGRAGFGPSRATEELR